MAMLDVSCDLSYEVQERTTFLFNVHPARTAHQSLTSESLVLEPSLPTEELLVGEGNRVVRLTAAAGTFRLSYQASVDLAPVTRDSRFEGQTAYQDIPDFALPYLNPSRYCESDKLGRFASLQFGDAEAGARVTAICEWVQTQLSYVPGSTDAQTTACDVLLQCTGVCRDYAHVAIALCRALGMPARYVSGYALGLEPPDFHGFLEVYLGDRWFLVDPTGMAPTAGLVRVGTGRDAADAAFATITGSATLRTMEVSATVRGGQSHQATEVSGSDEAPTVSTA